eukprot:gnl/TRDRNA2_/TRDRNA2_39268_c0_seq1.p1 gnl/TRDRNA2_/TRDRNA2_39268_c0~~gnl/TRDRNA2_/TRDRNA2_39268_c0_seq1.p1  ORF type:complete len:147 (-),score=27.60 gnl/TRDRNA2_/TRDRNA2_39268_c0_seq1:51-491(-)
MTVSVKMLKAIAFVATLFTVSICLQGCIQCENAEAKSCRAEYDAAIAVVRPELWCNQISKTYICLINCCDEKAKELMPVECQASRANEGIPNCPGRIDCPGQIVTKDFKVKPGGAQCGEWTVREAMKAYTHLVKPLCPYLDDPCVE